MTIVFLSNFYNHHQSFVSEQLFALTNGCYRFIETQPLDKERKSMGWHLKELPSFVLNSYEDSCKYKNCLNIINNADVVILGSAPKKMLKERFKKHKLTFVYSERLFKTGFGIEFFLKYPFRFNTMRKYIGKKNTYLLCASAFTSNDFKKIFMFNNKAYKWGYFPEVKKYDDIVEKIKLKRSKHISILFVSRLIRLKHPELPIQVARKLKEEGVNFHLTMIGRGNIESEVTNLIKEYGLTDDITRIKSMRPQVIRTYMEKSSIFLFTSDRNEGWGAVLNEAMNSGCAVVASSAIGSVPYLLRDNMNGYIYSDGNFDDLYYKVKDLCFHQDKREKFGVEAYKTMTEMWNAENASNRLLTLIDDLQNNGECNRFNDGPCSKAEIIKDGWYKL